MDYRTDTLSGRFGGQWAFLSNPPHHPHSRSLPPSSYLPRSDHSILSPSPAAPPAYPFNASRSSLSRLYPANSVGVYTSATNPSQPVLIRVHSADASAHAHPLPRGPRRRPIMSKNNELPPVSDFSIRGILAAIQEDIEGDIDAISEILGRSRLTLADQHESHMPPQGEIRAALRPLQGIAEASSSNERLAADNVLILAEDASLVGGSHSGSAAYGLLERLQAVPRYRRQRSHAATLSDAGPRLHPPRIHSSPAVLPDLSFSTTAIHPSQPRRSPRAPRFLLQNGSSQDPGAPNRPRTTNAVVSETYLSAGANGRTASNPPIVSEGGRHYPLYSYDESDLFETVPAPPSSPSKLRSFRARMEDLMMVHDLNGLTAWLTNHNRGESSTSQGAETHLRDILERHHEFTSDDPNLEPEEDENMYE